jgi:hypothetical protein
MSTKTNFKRVALVAVAALGLGVLTSVAPANAAGDATGIGADDIAIVAPTAGTAAAVGVCAIDPKALASDITSAISTLTVIAVGASLSFDTVTDGTGSLVISGPATWTTMPTAAGTISQDAKTVSFADAVLTTPAVLTASAAGAITVTAYSAADAGGTAVESYGITVVASCTSAAAPVAANTVLILAAAAANITAASTETALTYDESAYTVADVHINILLRNAYKADLTTAGILTATATNGALIAFDAGSLLSSTAFIQTAATASSGLDLKVAQNKVANPGQALSTTVTFQFNGVTVGTKDVKLYGVGSKIVVSDVTVGDNALGGTFKYIVQDNAGNQINSPDAVLSGAKAGITYGTIVSNAIGVNGTPSTTLAKGSGTFGCAASKSGSQDIAVGFVNAALAIVKSNTFTATCGQSTVDTFAVSMDKASYSPGEIATLTIKGTDEFGGIVSDNATHGAGVSSLSIPGMTIIGAAATTSDKFVSGALTYKYRVDQAEGNFVGQALVTADTDVKAETVSYSIKSTSGGVSMADVLKAIVSLIASINKQIAALQKALLKK